MKRTQWDIEHDKWIKEILEPYSYNVLNAQMQDWQKEGYVEVIHPTAKQANSMTTKTKKFLSKLFA